MVDVLLCTVGTSLIGHFMREKHEEQKHNLSPHELYHFLKSLSANDRLCGAEVNSNENIFSKHGEPRRIVFLVSETAEGKIVGEALRMYYNDRGINCNVVVVEGLQSVDERRFKRGLRRLVRLAAEEVYQACKKGFTCAINATGGFKAQISFAGLIGQVLEVPVFYQFENFKSVIEMPPMPVDFSFSLWLQHAHWLERLLREDTVESFQIEWENWNDRLKGLVETIECEGRILCSPTAVLQLLHEKHERIWRDRKSSLLPPAGKRSERPEIRVRYEHFHSPRAVAKTQNLAHRIWNRFARVTQISSFYTNPDAPCRVGFSAGSSPQEIKVFCHCGGVLAGLILKTTAKSKEQQMAALKELETQFGGDLKD